MNILIFNKDKVFKKFFKFYSYKIFINLSNNNFYCYFFTFFKLNIIFSLSNISIFLKNYIILNFGKTLNKKVFEFLGRCAAYFILDLKINFKIIIENLKKRSNIYFFFISTKKYLFF